MATYYVGLDVHSKQSTFVIEDAEGKVIAQGEVPTTRPAFERLFAVHHLPAGTDVALETGTVAFGQRCTPVFTLLRDAPKRRPRR